MNTTPLWVPLLVAGLGVLGTVVGTILGVLITQRRADRREQEAREHEVERERRQWAREDAARTFDHRREAYVEFYEALRGMALKAYLHGLGSHDPSLDDEMLPADWQAPTLHRLQHLRIYASPEVSVAATAAYDAAWRWGHETRHGQDDAAFRDREADYDDAEVALLDGIRRDLGVSGALDELWRR